MVCAQRVSYLSVGKHYTFDPTRGKVSKCPLPQQRPGLIPPGPLLANLQLSTMIQDMACAL